jgi:DNA-binding XRE family transcriptional regulator
MDKRKKKLLEEHGWKVGDAQSFLGLSDEEMEYIEIKISLSQKVKELRKLRKLTQEEMAKLIGSSQSRVAKIEAGDPSVSIDLQVKSLIALGVTRTEIAATIKSSEIAAV